MDRHLGTGSHHQAESAAPRKVARKREITVEELRSVIDDLDLRVSLGRWPTYESVDQAAAALAYRLRIPVVVVDTPSKTDRSQTTRHTAFPPAQERRKKKWITGPKWTIDPERLSEACEYLQIKWGLIIDTQPWRQPPESPFDLLYERPTRQELEHQKAVRGWHQAHLRTIQGIGSELPRGTEFRECKRGERYHEIWINPQDKAVSGEFYWEVYGEEAWFRAMHHVLWHELAHASQAERNPRGHRSQYLNDARAAGVEVTKPPRSKRYGQLPLERDADEVARNAPIWLLSTA